MSCPSSPDLHCPHLVRRPLDPKFEFKLLGSISGTVSSVEGPEALIRRNLVVVSFLMKDFVTMKRIVS